jgi:glyoxylase-like metal-dependent hydrolase (beta-lactamase superfamily II)
MLEIHSFTLGPVETNTYLIADPQAGIAAVIDPAWDGERLAGEAIRRGLRLTQVWLTHAHFDHIAGAAAIVKAAESPPPVFLHPGDLPLYRMQGGAPLFGMRIDPVPEPVESLSHGQVLQFGSSVFEVRHAPGHTPGHVVFYCAVEKVVFCGDVIFYSGIGRTDLPGGSYHTLIESIQTQILSLPDDTRLLSGHGPATTVGQERVDNPFL